MTTKVSVVIPAYRSGDGIYRAVGSLAAQTLPNDEFEVVIVDDGSPDDTYDRLRSIRDSHSNVRIARIENSGWPSRPRNVGIDMAHGEYVLFMDHDDYLYPDALRSSYDYASANNADVLSPKESKTTDVGWGISDFTRNIPNARDSVGIASLLPMMPHKFYRRQFLNQHSIRFPEGSRMLWEDVYFNIEVYRYASVISVLSDTPVYRWVHTGVNNSSTYGPDSQEFWDKLQRLFAFIAQALPGDEFADARDAMFLQQYRTRVLGRFNQMLSRGAGVEARTSLQSARRILDAFVPERFDRKLGKVLQARAKLLRAGRLELMRDLSAYDADTAAVSRSESVRWGDRALSVVAETCWGPAPEKPLQFLERDGKILRPVPPEIEAALPASVLDVTDDIRAAEGTVTITSRDEYVTWAVATTSDVRLNSAAEHRVGALVSTQASVDMNAAAFGRPLEDGVWDFHVRTSWLGVIGHRGLRTATAPRCALIDGRAAVAYRNTTGTLSLDLGQNQRSIVAHGGPAVDRATFTRSGLRVKFTLPLDSVYVAGQTQLPGTVGLWPFGRLTARILSSYRVARLRTIGPWASRILPGTPAELSGGEDGAVLTGEFRAFPGVYTLICRFGRHSAATPIRVHVSLTGRVAFVRLAD